jgi:hypothetical protein
LYDFHDWDWRGSEPMPRRLRILLWSACIAVISIASVLLFLTMTARP